MEKKGRRPLKNSILKYNILEDTIPGLDVEHIHADRQLILGPKTKKALRFGLRGIAKAVIFSINAFTRGEETPPDTESTALVPTEKPGSPLPRRRGNPNSH